MIAIDIREGWVSVATKRLETETPSSNANEIKIIISGFSYQRWKMIELQQDSISLMTSGEVHCELK